MSTPDSHTVDTFGGVMNDPAVPKSARDRAPASPPEVTASPRPRRVRRATWLDTRFVAGLALVAASVVLGAHVLSTAHRTTAFVAMARDVAAGTVLDADDVVIVRASLPSAPDAVYLTRTDEVVGRRTSQPLGSGEFLPRSAVATPPALTWLEVPLDADAAPPLSVGQRVTLWLADAPCPPAVVVADVTVQHLRAAATGVFATGGGQAIEIAVTPDAADRVLAALARTSRDHTGLRVGIVSGPVADRDSTPLPPLTCPDAS